MFKRHIIISEEINYQNHTEIDWHHEESSGKCLEINNIVEAALTISNYTKSNSDYTFDIIEFSKRYYYYVKRVTVSNDKVSDSLIEIKKDAINRIFGCPSSVPPIDGKSSLITLE